MFYYKIDETPKHFDKNIFLGNKTEIYMSYISNNNIKIEKFNHLHIEFKLKNVCLKWKWLQQQEYSFKYVKGIMTNCI